MKNNRSGIIILTTLWIMAILSVFALGMGYRSSLEVRLAGYQVDKIKTLYLAKAAVQEIKEYISIDLNSDTNGYDSLYRCGVHLLSEQTPEMLFKNIAVGDGYYNIKYKIGSDENNQPIWRYGLSDEERKININTADPKTLKILFELLGVEPVKSESIAASIVDWRDSDSLLTDYGAEDDYYQSLETPYDCKDAAFETLEELLLVKDVTPSIFNKIKNYLTVYGEGKVNINTAGQVVLEALAMYTSYNLNINDIDSASVANKIIDSRDDGDNIEGTSDDTPCQNNDISNYLDSIDVDDRIRGSLGNLLIIKSSNFRAEIQATSADNKVIKKVTVILDDTGVVKSWQEE